ncbi:putative DNA-binding protein in cluster with Type I restriction-modification system [Halorhodospira halochloris]|uniref:DNA-binding protein in cluster with Type I restriction-modification system n=1 Tax=Halorhodospira halochloris TaxID=1052 RepID=A0A0X8X8Q7_HALHR|nr:putative DNA-binding protein in cluster with Type I restriction-modification system [Halorhodospira halochloris]
MQVSRESLKASAEIIIYPGVNGAKEATTEESSVLRQEGQRQVRRRIKHYNLDTIISVGYRVNSRRAVQFRQWATRVLREHLIQGWTLNRQRFEENARELEAALALVRKAAHSPEPDVGSGRGLVDIVSRYAQTFLLLQRYDEGLLTETRAELIDPDSRRPKFGDYPPDFFDFIILVMPKAILRKTHVGLLLLGEPRMTGGDKFFMGRWIRILYLGGR